MQQSYQSQAGADTAKLRQIGEPEITDYPHVIKKPGIGC